MFQIGDHVVYGNSGICRVENVEKLDFNGISNERIYYTLLPLYDAGSKVFVPVDSEKTVIRYALTREQVTELLDELPKIEPIWVADDRGREQEYKNALKSCDCRKLIQIIKTLYLRKKERVDDGKKMTAVDERYFNLAEDKLYGEMAAALEIEKSKMSEHIKLYLEENVF